MSDKSSVAHVSGAAGSCLIATECSESYVPNNCESGGLKYIDSVTN